MQLVYNGPHDAVEVVLPNGATTTVARGGSADFPSDVAGSLLEQGEDNWRKKRNGNEKKEG